MNVVPCAWVMAREGVEAQWRRRRLNVIDNNKFDAFFDGALEFIDVEAAVFIAWYY